jgi:archaellum component FlaC
MATTMEKFTELENRIVRTVELVKNTQKELAGARAQVSRLEGELEELRRERELVKNKVELLLENLSSLSEETGVQTEAASNRR